MKIVILDWRTMTMNNDLSTDEFHKFGEVKVYDLTKPEQTVERIGDADAVLCNKVVISREIIDKFPNLKYIGLFATGYNNIDIDYASAKGITVCNAGQYSTNAVAQQVFAYILDHYNRVNHYNSLVSEGKWQSSDIFSYFPIPTHEICGKTLSIFGFGSIGRAVAKIGESFGMNIIVSTRTAPADCNYEVTDLFTAAEKADVLTFHCPLNDMTKGIINAGLLSKMKSSAILINTSRGAVAVEKDLAYALNNERIAAAYLDVLEAEPMSADTPLKNAKNCIITPHTSWAAFETRKRLLNIVVENLSSWIAGTPKNKVN